MRIVGQEATQFGPAVAVGSRWPRCLAVMWLRSLERIVCLRHEVSGAVAFSSLRRSEQTSGARDHVRTCFRSRRQAHHASSQASSSVYFASSGRLTPAAAHALVCDQCVSCSAGLQGRCMHGDVEVDDSPGTAARRAFLLRYTPIVPLCKLQHLLMFCRSYFHPVLFSILVKALTCVFISDPSNARAIQARAHGIG